MFSIFQYECSVELLRYLGGYAYHYLENIHTSIFFRRDSQIRDWALQWVTFLNVSRITFLIMNYNYF